MFTKKFFLIIALLCIAHNPLNANITIRQATCRDIPQLQSTTGMSRLDLFSMFFPTKKKTLLLVAEDNQQSLVGFVYAHQRTLQCLVCEKILVHPVFQNCNVEHSLAMNLFNQIKNNKIKLCVRTSNKQMINLFQSLAFEMEELPQKPILNAAGTRTTLTWIKPQNKLVSKL